jgi:hypothetical protein
LSATESPVRTAVGILIRKALSSVAEEAIFRSRWSYSLPRKAKGATMAPTLTPDTTRKTGRVPCAVQPHSTPAAKAPLEPPPLIASTLTGSSTP